MEVGCVGMPEPGSCGSGGRPFVADVEMGTVNIYDEWSALGRRGENLQPFPPRSVVFGRELTSERQRVSEGDAIRDIQF